MMSMDVIHVHAEKGEDHGKVRVTLILKQMITYVCHNPSFRFTTKVRAC
jgi:hypothetical protein